MFALSLGIGEVNDVLPGIVYALLSGLNASTVGIIALSAVQVRIVLCDKPKYWPPKLYSVTDISI